MDTFPPYSCKIVLIDYDLVAVKLQKLYWGVCFMSNDVNHCCDRNQETLTMLLGSCKIDARQKRLVKLNHRALS